MNELLQEHEAMERQQEHIESQPKNPEADEISSTFGQKYQYNIEHIINELNQKFNKNLNTNMSEYSSISSTSYNHFQSYRLKNLKLQTNVRGGEADNL